MKRNFQPAIQAVLSLLFLAAGSSFPAFSQQGIITTFAGGGPNSPVALSSDIDPRSVAVDASGNIFIAATWLNQVFKADPAGNFTLVAGTGTQGFGGDGGPAANASLSVPSGVAVDAHGNLFIADSGNSRIRRVDGVTGIITTVAGNFVSGQNYPGFSGDGGPATSASMNYPTSVAVDGQGNLFIADASNQRIRRLDGATGIITTVAGSGVPDSTGRVASGFSGDGGPATSAQLAGPRGVALDAHGNLFIADSENNRIRRVDAASGIITAVAGNGAAGFSGDGGAATSASLFAPLSVAVDAQGNVFVADLDNSRIRRVDAATEIITTVAGDGNVGFSGDGGPATSARLVPFNVAVDSQGDLFIADNGSGRVRRVDASSGTINTVVGGGSGGDGGTATGAVLIYPMGVAVDSSGNLFIADAFNQRVRRVDALTGIIGTVAGNGTAGYSANGGPATNSSVEPVGVAVDTQGNVFIADNLVIHRVDTVTGIITTVAGDGNVGFSGDGGPATSASFYGAQAVAVDAHENLFIADMDNQRVRRVDGITGIITTVAGSGVPNASGLVPYGFSGDGGPATSAQLAQPWDVALDAHGNLFIADELNFRIRRVDAVTGAISTVAGDGDFAHSGDGSPATSAGIGQPFGLAVDAQDNLFISSGYDVRRVDAVTGIVTTVAGSNATLPGFSGDGGPATSAGLRSYGLIVDVQGKLFIADPTDNRVRVVPLPPFVALSATTLSFTSQAKGTTSAAQTVTLTNTGLVPLTISGVALVGTNPGDFAQTNNCGGSLEAGTNCKVNVTFTPTETTARAATLTITDGAPGSPHAVELMGTAQTQSKDFSLVVSGSSSSATVSAGQTATYNLSITPLGGLSGAVSVTCSGAPSLATCKASPASVNLSGSGASPISVTVSTTAPSGVVMRPKPPAGPWVWLWIAGLLAAVATWMMAARRLAWQRAWVPLAVVLLCAALWTACGGGINAGGGGGGGSPGTPAGTYALTVTGNMGSLAPEHQVALTLKVN